MSERVLRRRMLAGLAASAVVVFAAYFAGDVGAFVGELAQQECGTTTVLEECPTTTSEEPTTSSGPIVTIPTTSSTSTTFATTTTIATTTTRAAIAPIQSTTTTELTTSTNLLVPGDGTKGAESTTTTTIEVDEAGGGVSDATIVWSVVAGLVAVAAAVGYLTWRYWVATKPHPVAADEAVTAATPAVGPGTSVFGSP